MTEQLHRLIDSGAAQPVINERIVAVVEADRVSIKSLAESLDRIAEMVEKQGDNFGSRIGFLEKWGWMVFGAVGLLSFASEIVIKVLWK